MLLHLNELEYPKESGSYEKSKQTIYNFLKYVKASSKQPLKDESEPEKRKRKKKHYNLNMKKNHHRHLNLKKPNPQNAMEKEKTSERLPLFLKPRNRA